MRIQSIIKRTTIISVVHQYGVRISIMQGSISVMPHHRPMWSIIRMCGNNITIKWACAAFLNLVDGRSWCPPSVGGWFVHEAALALCVAKESKSAPLCSPRKLICCKRARFYCYYGRAAAYGSLVKVASVDECGNVTRNVRVRCEPFPMIGRCHIWLIILTMNYLYELFYFRMLWCLLLIYAAHRCVDSSTHADWHIQMMADDILLKVNYEE